jgi:hypothetical protein
MDFRTINVRLASRIIRHWHKTVTKEIISILDSTDVLQILHAFSSRPSHCMCPLQGSLHGRYAGRDSSLKSGNATRNWNAFLAKCKRPHIFGDHPSKNTARNIGTQ